MNKLDKLDDGLYTLLMTCRLSLFANLNIYGISQIELSDFIIGKRFNDVSIGKMKPVNTTKKLRADFGNQCSMNLQLKVNSETYACNFKIFNNGDIIITGCKYPEIIEMFVEKFTDIIENYSINVPDKLSDCFKTLGHMARFIQNHYTQLLCICCRYNIIINKDPITNQIINDIISTNCAITIDDRVYNQETSIIDSNVDEYISPEISRAIRLLFTIYYYSSRSLQERLENNREFQELVDNAYYNNAKLPCVIHFDSCKEPLIRTENINVLLKTYYSIDRLKVIELLNTVYKEYNYYYSYEQSMYQGINVKWKQPGCIYPHKGYTCSLLIFQEHKIIITGCKEISTVNKVARIIQEMLTVYKSKIIRNVYEISEHFELKPKFSESAIIKSPYYIFIPKKIFYNCPRNYFYLKTIELMGE